MKFFKKIVGFALVVALALSALGCSEKGDGVPENLSEYVIDAVFDDESKTLSVKQSVDYINEFDVELNELYFHLYPNAYREDARFKPFTDADMADAYPDGVSYGGINITALKVGGKTQEIVIGGQDDDILIVSFGDCLMPTSRIKIEMEYTVTVPNVRHRLGYYNKTVNLGNFYPIACVYENGEFESSPYYSNGDPFYSAVANYKVSITAPKKYTAAMSGLCVVTETQDEKKTFASQQAARDFAIVLGEFQQVSTTADGVAVTYYYYDDESFDASLNAAADSVKTFNELFGKYPYKSLSVVQTHFLNGGMEYPALVYASDRQRGELYRDVIIHEVAHQWWYALVGNNQISHAWLDETLAEYSATLFYEKNPGYNVGYSARIADAMKTYSLFCDRFENTVDKSMDRKLPEFSMPIEYTVMTYVKGQIMMDSLRKTIGDDAFFKGFKKYFEENIYKIAQPENLIGAFEKASGKDLMSFFNTWLDGNVMTFAKS